MSTSNLKTSIAALSLCVSAVVIYIHLPYVIAAVSGSGAIEALPLAIFAVSAIVALVSVIYLIRLAVSRADNKKEEPQKFVCKNCTNLENKPNVPAPQSPPVTLGTQLNPSVSAPPPPPPLPLLLPPGGLANWNPSKNNTTSEKPSVGTTQKNTPFHPAKSQLLIIYICLFFLLSITFGIFITRRFSGTLGQLLCCIRIKNANTLNNITLMQATIRYVSLEVISFILSSLFIMDILFFDKYTSKWWSELLSDLIFTAIILIFVSAIFDQRKQFLHDKIAKTVAVKRKAEVIVVNKPSS